jgi:WD40 repeat protein
MLAVGSADKTVRLWDLSDPRHPTSLGGPLTGATNYVYSVAFTPNGQTLIAGSIDHTVAVWDVSQPRQPTLLASLTDAAESVFVVVVSPDGRTIAAGTAEKAVRLWPIDPASAAAEVCAVAGDPITPAEWAQYIPNRPYQPPC